MTEISKPAGRQRAWRVPARAFVVTFAALAAFCLLMAGRYGFERIQTLRLFEHATGEVTGELRQTGQGQAEATDYAPLVRFKTADGAVVSVTGQVRSSYFRHKPGDQVPVYYDPRMPQKALLGSFLDFWLPIAAWAGSALLCALAAFGAERLSRRVGR